LNILLTHGNPLWAQDEFDEELDKKERFPSYFGIQVRALLPTQFIGQSELTLGKNGFSTNPATKYRVFIRRHRSRRINEAIGF